jgi:hypothetical protein
VSQLRLPEGSRGPFFVSLGDPSKLDRFLEINAPPLSGDRVFVDGYARGAYAAAGLGKFTDSDPGRAKEAAGKLRAPDLGGPRVWLRYLANAAFLSPIPSSTESGSKEETARGGGGGGIGSMVPEGVLQLGGTLVVRGDEILYQHADAVPGDTPDLSEVARVLEEAVTASSSPRGPASTEGVQS